RIGAVNTIYKRGPMLRGDNTDAGGFTDALSEHEVDVRGARVLLLGAGGAARACADQLLRAGAHVVVANRSPERLEALVGSIPAMAGAGHPHGAMSPLPRTVDDFDVVVNATSL